MGSFPSRKSSAIWAASSTALSSHTWTFTRITKATAAFGALHYCFFSNQRVSLKDKGRVYAVLVLTIFLHGSECWSLREDLYDRLRVFHNRCVRTLCRVKMRQVRRHRIRQDTLNARVGLQSLDYILLQHPATSRACRGTAHGSDTRDPWEPQA